MNKQKLIRYTLVIAAICAVTIPLINQVRTARSEQSQSAQSPGLPPPVFAPTTKPAPVDPDKVLASTDGLTVTGADYNYFVSRVPPQKLAQLSNPNVRKTVLGQLMQAKLLAREAERQKLDQKPQVKHELQLQHDEVLINALFQELQSSEGNADHQYFESHKSDFDDVKARHILIRTSDSRVPLAPGKKDLTDDQAKAKAQQIEEQLKKGGDFASIAKSESDDTGSAVKGGDLGTFAPYTMDPEFSKAALGLKPNEISQPVKTQFGYHVIQLLSDQPKTYEQAKSEIPQARLNALLHDLSEKYKTQYNEDFISGATASATPTTRPAASAQAQTGKG